MTREQKIAKAKTLREKGWTYREIGGTLGVSDSCIYKWLNPNWAKEQNAKTNAKRGPAKRKWERENRAECPQCGAKMGAGTRCPSARPKCCAECKIDEARSRTVRYIEMRKEGLLNPEIAKRDGVKSWVVATVLSSADRYGLTVPPSPYFRRRKK